MYVCFPLNSLKLSEQESPGSPHPSIMCQEKTGERKHQRKTSTNCRYHGLPMKTHKVKVFYLGKKNTLNRKWCFVTCCFFHCVRVELAVRKQHGNERGDTCRKGSKRLHKYSWRIAAKLISTENQGSQRAQGNVLRNNKKSSSHDSDTVLYIDLHLFLYPFP